MNKTNLSNASNKRRSNHKPSQSSSASLSKRPVLGRTDSSNLHNTADDNNNNNTYTNKSNIETTTNITTVEILDRIDNDIHYDVSCICGKPLIRVTLSESYSDEPSVCCNMCFMIYRNPKDVIYICELRKTTQFHNNGYGFCQSCAAKLSIGSGAEMNCETGAELIKNRLNGTISMLEHDGNKHEFLPFMDRMSWFERVGLEYLAKQHMTDDEMKEMKDKLQCIKDSVIERAFGHLKSKILEIDTMLNRLQTIQMKGNMRILKDYNNKIRIHRRQLLRIQNESSGKYRNQYELLNKLSKMRHCINIQTSEYIASCVCGEELFAMSVQECNYSDSWWCSHCCETYYKHDMLYHCENGKKCIYNELMQYIYDLCENCWNRLKIKDYKHTHNHDIQIIIEQKEADVDSIHLMIRKRLWESLKILQQCITNAHNTNNDRLEVMDKLAKRICNFETQFVKLKTCLADEERDKCSSKMQELVNILKQHLSLCLCGDIMIKLKATNYYCAHCFQTFKGKERVITFCRRRDKCKFYQNGYRLCEHCSNDLMKEGITQCDDNNNNIEYIIGNNNNNISYVDEQKGDDQPQQQPSQQISNTNNNTNIIANHNINNNNNNPNIIEQKNNEQKDNDKKNIDWTVCCRIEQRLQQSIQILEQSATDDINNNNNNNNNNNINDDNKDDKTQWNEHWNDWISRCNQFSSCLNKTKEHLYSHQFKQITDNFEIVKKNAVQRTLKQTNESITEISNALSLVTKICDYRKLNSNVTEFRRQLLKMKRHGQDEDIDNQLNKLKLIRDGINIHTGDRITTCICGEELFRRKASECYGNNYWCNRCFKTYSKDTYLFHCEVHKECEYHQFGYDLCEDCAMVLRNDNNIINNNESNHIKRIVYRLRASLLILENDVSNNNGTGEEHKDDMAKRVDNFEMQYDPLIKWLDSKYNDEISDKLNEICDLIKPYLPLCLCGSWFKHGSCDNAFICRCCSKSYEKGVETYYCKNTENCLYWKHGYNLCETCALTYKDKKHKKNRLTDRIIHRLWNSINHIQLQYNKLINTVNNSFNDNDSWDSLVLRYDNCEQYIQKCTYTHWLYNILSTNACLDNEQTSNMRHTLNRLGELFKSHVPVCFCGDVFIYVQSPYELDCKHCFKELKENDKTYFCKSRDDCQHWNNSYYLCEDCVKELRKKHNKFESVNERIKSRLNRSVQILQGYIEELIKNTDNNNIDIDNNNNNNMEEDDGKRWLKMAYKVDQCKQHSEKLKIKLLGEDDNKHNDNDNDNDNESDSETKEEEDDIMKQDIKWCKEFDNRFDLLISSVKIRVPLCLCGAFFVHETSPIDFRCRHCFKLYDADKVVIHYCQQQRDCQHFNSDYYLCNICAMSLRKSCSNENIKDRAYKRLMNSINIINEAVNNAQQNGSDDDDNNIENIETDEWKDVSVRVYFYEQQLERLNEHLELNEKLCLRNRLDDTLLLMKSHLATCLCGNLFVSGPSPIDYECRSCFHECRVEENIYVCKSKQKCEHWRNHYYICDNCSILLRKSNKFKSEQLRIVDRLQGAIQFITNEFNKSMQLKCNNNNNKTDDKETEKEKEKEEEEEDSDSNDSENINNNKTKDLEIFNKYLHRTNSFEQNFLSQMKTHISSPQLDEINSLYKILKSYILRVSSNYIDEKYRFKLETQILIFGFIRELYFSLNHELYYEYTQIFSSVPEYVFHICFDYYFQIHPQIFIISMAKGIFRSLPMKFDNIELCNINDGISNNLSFYDMKSFNKSSFNKYNNNRNGRRKSSRSSLPLVLINGNSNDKSQSEDTKTVIKHKSWNKKECGFSIACNISIPSFIRKIKPSLFNNGQSHYDVIFKCGGEKHNNNINKQYTNEAIALIINSSNFNNYYSDHYAFKSRHIRLKSEIKYPYNHKKRKKRIALTYKELPPNGYALSLPSLPQKRRCQILFDYKRKQLLAYCDNKFDIYTLQFNDKLTNENEWKWNSLPNEMKWSRTRPSFGICGNNLNKLFIVGDIQTHHAKYAEIYEFNTQKWIQLTSQVPYIAHNGILYYDNCNNLMYYCGGQQRNCGYYNLYKHKWFEMKYKTQYIYNKNNSTMWNSLHNNNKQILWIANANNCEFYDTRMSQSNNKNKWQIFPNINDNNTHLKIQNYLNVKFDNTNCDYTLLSRI